MYRYFAIFKPYGMISQFTKDGNHPTLADLNFKFPIDAYPVGRLDADSEGLLLLTNDKRINAKLLDPGNKHVRTYLVQVEGEITSEALLNLQNGVVLNEKGDVYKTLPGKAESIAPPVLPERNPPVRFRKNIPTSWIQLSIHEGKNRQVRKMTASVGFPTLRLVRLQIESLGLEKLENGWVQEINKIDFYNLLKLRS